MRTLCGPTCAPSISPHGHGFAVANDIVQVGDGALELPAIDGLGGFSSVFERDTEVSASGAG